LISDVFYYLLFYVIKYRKKVIIENIKIAFPENTIRENHDVARKFVKHFADFLIESLKTLSIKEEVLRKRYVFLNPEIVQDFVKQERSPLVLASHYGNWEWMFYYPQITKVETWAAYTPLSNPIFDRLMVMNRERYGLKVVPSKQAAANYVRLKNEGVTYVNCMASDQSPAAHYKNRAEFLGKNVPFFAGPEAYAKKFNLPVFYSRIRKVARSKYTLEHILITDDPSNTEPNWITSEYIRLMEEDIKRAPEFYLWSHRRFKHAMP